MGDIADLIDKVVYLDSKVFIYAVEGFAQHRPFIEELFRQIDGGRIDAVTSELTMAEVLVKPFEAGREDIGDLYRELLQTSGHLTVVPIDRSILMQAARYRSVLGVKLPDAIHVATALAANCDVLLSNDQKIRVPDSIALHPLR